MRPIVTAIVGSPNITWEGAYDAACERIAGQESVEILDNRYVIKELTEFVDLFVRVILPASLKTQPCLDAINKDLADQRRSPARGLLYVVIMPVSNSRLAWLRSLLDAAEGPGSRWAYPVADPTALDLIVGEALMSVSNRRRRHASMDDSPQSAAADIMSDHWFPGDSKVQPPRKSTFGQRGKA